MSRFYFTLIFLFSSTLARAANTVDLQLNLSFSDGEKSTPKIIALVGKPAMISVKRKDGSGYQISAVSTLDQTRPDVIQVSMQIFQLKNEFKKLISSPSILARNGQLATMSVAGADSFSVSVLPNLDK